jgi:hypothetical protein
MPLDFPCHGIRTAGFSSEEEMKLGSVSESAIIQRGNEEYRLNADISPPS